jgi:hypothetical protein
MKVLLLFERTIADLFLVRVIISCMMMAVWELNGSVNGNGRLDGQSIPEDHYVSWLVLSPVE